MKGSLSGSKLTLIVAVSLIPLLAFISEGSSSKEIQELGNQNRVLLGKMDDSFIVVQRKNDGLPAQVSLTVDGEKMKAGGFVDYSWNFGDGNTAKGEQVRHLYTVGGEYNVSLLTLNKRGEAANYTSVVSVEQ